MGAFEDYNIIIDAFTNNKKIDSNINEAAIRLRKHIKNNPNNYISIATKEYFFSIMKKEFLNPDLEDAFDMHKDLPYYRNIIIYNNLPFINSFKNAKWYYFHLFFDKIKTNPTDFYIACNKIRDNYFPEEMPSKIFSKTVSYCSNNPLLMANILNTTEKAKNNTDKNSVTCSIGENYICDKLNTYGGKIFDPINNGFGFDILYVDTELTKEYLIEVKATVKGINYNPHFELLSDNENNVLLKTTRLPNTEYIVERVYVDTSNNTCTNTSFYYDKQQKDFVEKDIIFDHANKKLIKKLN